MEGKIDVSGIYVEAFLTVFWSVAMVDFWLRKESKWGVFDFEKEAQKRPKFSGSLSLFSFFFSFFFDSNWPCVRTRIHIIGKWTYNSVTGLWDEFYSVRRRACKQLMSASLLLAWTAFSVGVVIYILTLTDDERGGSTRTIYLSVASAVAIQFLKGLYPYIAHVCSEWENHRTDLDYDNEKKKKTLVFSFFNTFASLYYIAFIRPGIKGTSKTKLPPPSPTFRRPHQT